MCSASSLLGNGRPLLRRRNRNAAPVKFSDRLAAARHSAARLSHCNVWFGGYSPRDPTGQRAKVRVIASLIFSTEGDCDSKYSPNFWLKVRICASVSVVKLLGVTWKPNTSQITS